MKNLVKAIVIMIAGIMLVSCLCMTVFAEGVSETAQITADTETAAEAEGSSTGVKAMAAAACVGLAAAAGAISMSIAISKTNDGISRQPEASGSLRTSLMLGLVFIETAIIYALIVAILIIFVL